MEKTVNEWLSLAKTVKERMGGLKGLRTEVCKKESWMGDKDKVTEPLYDVKEVDKKIVVLQTFLYELDSAIKQSNAVVRVNVDCNLDTLLSPLQ